MPVSASSTQHKPRMLYFMARTERYSPLNFEGTNDRPLKALRESFEITLINYDGDFEVLCDQYQPDIALFDCGSGAAESRLEITNVARSSAIPKIGFMKGDAWSASRTKLLYEIDEWGLDAVFEQGDLALKEYLPQVRQLIYYWPLFVDTDLYKDYESYKSIPFLILGQTETPAYDWRGRIRRAVESNIPSLVFPHPGYRKQFEDAFVIIREKYARTINSSLFALGGGAFNQQMLKKNLEIPACRSCLITDRTPANELFGFEDMVNCVIADEKNVVEKLRHLANHRYELEKITDSGHALIQSKHSYTHRKQILQWFSLRNQLETGQQIVQTDLFGDLQIAGESTKQESVSILLGGQDRRLLREGDRLLTRGDYERAAALFKQAGDFTGFIPDADIRQAICMLHLGHPISALRLILKQFALVRRLEIPGPDPIEWGLFILGMACQGELDEAVRFAKYFPALSHPILDQTRWIVLQLARDGIPPHRSNRIQSTGLMRIQSIHLLPPSYVENYTANARAILRACGQSQLVSDLLDPSEEEVRLKQDEGARASQHRDVQAVLLTIAESYRGLDDAIHSIEDLIAAQKILGSIKKPLKRFMPRKARSRMKNALSKIRNRVGSWIISLGKKIGSE
jgi:hypothetical protein